MSGAESHTRHRSVRMALALAWILGCNCDRKVPGGPSEEDLAAKELERMVAGEWHLDLAQAASGGEVMWPEEVISGELILGENEEFRTILKFPADSLAGAWGTYDVDSERRLILNTVAIFDSLGAPFTRSVGEHTVRLGTVDRVMTFEDEDGVSYIWSRRGGCLVCGG